MGQIGHGIIYCWNQPDRRGFSIENAPETYATLEQLLLSLPLRHEDYGMDPSRAAPPIDPNQGSLSTLPSEDEKAMANRIAETIQQQQQQEQEQEQEQEQNQEQQPQSQSPLQPKQQTD